jgi:hypothetical protein
MEKNILNDKKEGSLQSQIREILTELKLPQSVHVTSPKDVNSFSTTNRVPLSDQ